MDRQLLPIVLIATILFVAVAILLPGERSPAPDRTPLLPWSVQVDTMGRTTVLGVTLGVTPLGELEQLVGEEAKLQLFVRDGRPVAVEGFFNQVRLAGLHAQVVVTLSLGDEELEQIYRRGVRISRAGSGSSQVKLAGEDGERARQTAIGTLTYIPRSRSIDQPLLIERFGKPARQIDEPNGTRHLLYPDRGIDIALPAEGKVVIQYLLPDDFRQVVAPLDGS